MMRAVGCAFCAGSSNEDRDDVLLSALCSPGVAASALSPASPKHMFKAQWGMAVKAQRGMAVMAQWAKAVKAQWGMAVKAQRGMAVKVQWAMVIKAQ